MIIPQTPFIILFGLILGILCGQALLLIANLRSFYRVQPLPPRNDEDALPLLSILVPARNEERCIEACVRSLVQQHYEQLEVLVLNDHSSDATAAIVQHLIAELPKAQANRLRLLQGEPLPPGWVGKNFACHQLARHAQGEVLLFTDADTVHQPQAALATIQAMRGLGVTLLTAQPEQELYSVGERLVVPLLNFTLLTLLPIALVYTRPEPALGTGNGQYLCFQRATYEAIGGHLSVKEHILEDVRLARATKAAGYRMAFVDGYKIVSCRMYRSFAEVWAGFSKNLFALYNFSLPFALSSLLLNLILFVLPPALLLAAPFLAFPPPLLILAAAVYTLAVLMRMAVTLRFTSTMKPIMLLLCLLHPLSMLLECLIIVNSIRWHYRKQGVTWKGRQYH